MNVQDQAQDQAQDQDQEAHTQQDQTQTGMDKCLSLREPRAQHLACDEPCACREGGQGRGSIRHQGQGRGQVCACSMA